MGQAITPTQREVMFEKSDLIVSKTDLKGRITYANATFCDISGYSETEVIGQPHAMIRHPDMPRAVFRLLWDAILAGREIFAYVKNMTKTGDHYWVFAHVTPSFDGARQVTGFHSNRRVPDRAALAKIEPLYRELTRIEAGHKNGKEALAASSAHLSSVIGAKGHDYDRFVFSL
ncbi:PAS domain-containing protein [Salinarimonas ramus]|uniref:Chemotaxis protein n=1 Tax=Salinarimonas ramus TaxID=690164 RepID=A0A917QCX7_9HYPH|nr:PAS domain-containing protein [Salinarimonas ramus]GGK44011.1 chemotaxis protein [Salinarimonas ramus]